MEATLTSKGQVTIPKAVRDALHLRTGDRLDFILEADGTVRVLPITGSVRRLKGMLPKPSRALTLDEMDDAIAKGCGRRMIGLDTNVLVRYIVRDDPAQTALADHCIEHRCTREAPGYISHLVLAELIWVLECGYGYPRPMLGEVLVTLLSSEEIRIQDAPLIRLALGAFLAGAADFADCLIGALHRRAECETTVTFDKKAARLPTHRLLE